MTSIKVKKSKAIAPNQPMENNIASLLDHYIESLDIPKVEGIQQKIRKVEESLPQFSESALLELTSKLDELIQDKTKSNTKAGHRRNLSSGNQASKFDDPKASEISGQHTRNTYTLKNQGSFGEHAQDIEVDPQRQLLLDKVTKLQQKCTKYENS